MVIIKPLWFYAAKVHIPMYFWEKKPYFPQKNHGGPASEDRHVGDLGNINVGSNGESIVFISDNQVKLTGEPEFSVAGRSIVIHENEDDLGASGDASGNAGARLKCCVIVMDTIPPSQ